jgi:hypothetical protein
MPPSSTAFSALVGGVVGVEGQVVAENDEAVGGVAHQPHQRRQALDVLAVDLDELQAAGGHGAVVDVGVNGLDQRRLAHAARAPEQRVVGGQAPGEALGIGDELVADEIDAVQQRNIDAIDLGHRLEGERRRLPDEGVGGVEVRTLAHGRREALKRRGDSRQKGGLVGGLRHVAIPEGLPARGMPYRPAFRHRIAPTNGLSTWML